MNMGIMDAWHDEPVWQIIGDHAVSFGYLQDLCCCPNIVECALGCDNKGFCY